MDQLDQLDLLDQLNQLDHLNLNKNKNKNKNIYFVYFKLYNILLVLLNGHMCRRGHSG